MLTNKHKKMNLIETAKCVNIEYVKKQNNKPTNLRE